jgi:hypothetical protein
VYDLNEVNNLHEPDDGGVFLHDPTMAAAYMIPMIAAA